MTIRLSGHAKYPEIDATMADEGEYTVRTVYGQGIRLAYANTREEAEQARRAFENVLAPRFTRDEAIAIVKAAIPLSPWADVTGPSIEMVRGIRLALEALAAAGAFVDDPRGDYPNDMGDKLDRARIR